MISLISYGTTDNYWDKRIPFEPLWEQYKRITKPNAAIVLFANNKFEMELAASAIDIFKYKWVWVKNIPVNFISCKNKPMVKHEDILVFSRGTAANKAKNNMVYNPQNLKLLNKMVSNGNRKTDTIVGRRPCNVNYRKYIQVYTNYPSDVLFFDSPATTKRFHTNQKPTDLLEYLIKTYTNEGELVLDNCIGSGSTAVAAINTNRRFIGFETDKNYFEIANKRIKKVFEDKEMRLFA